MSAVWSAAPSEALGPASASAMSTQAAAPSSAPRARVLSASSITDLLSRVIVASLFTLLCRNLLDDFLRTGRITGLLLLTSEFLVVVLTIVRRRASLVDRSWAAACVTVVSVVAPPLMRTSDAGGVMPDIVTACVSSVGVVLVIVGKLSIGRSFGIAPANRGVVVRGPYQFVRHPIYTGYLISYAAFVLAHPRPWNLAILVCATPAFVVRALFEERILSEDETYREYCTRVSWHLVPGLF